MGLFDIFGRGEQKARERTEISRFNEFDNLSTPETQTKQQPLTFFYPKDFAEVANIIDCLKTGKNVVVDLTKISLDSSKRILDFLSGAIYALGGGVCEVQKEVFMFSPDGVEIK